MDSRDYLFMTGLLPAIPRPKLGPSLTVNSISISLVAPVISGTTAVGQVLSCTTGSWAFEPISYLYHWRRDGKAIAGASANTYTLVASDTGKTITCAVVAINVEGQSNPAVSNGLYIPALDVPTNSVAPIINGNTFVGSALSCTTGTWDHTPLSYAYQWKRGGVNISGATSNAYIVNLLDAGLSVTCAVTATNVNGPSSPVTSNALAIDNIPVNSVAPVISGTTTVGQTLSCTNGTWSYTPTGYSYQWKREGVSIGGATSSTYVLAVADASTSITCAVTASNPQGTSTPATSNALSIGAVGVPVISVAPVISGTTTVGQTLSCTTGTWTNTPTSYAYQWKRNGTNIGSATLATYLLVIADAGTSITCEVTATNITGASSPSASNTLAIGGGGGTTSGPIGLLFLMMGVR
jgi:hypothetical protein